MPRITHTPFLLSLLCLPALAQQQFQCAGAAVTIAVDSTLPLRSTEGAEVILRVVQGPRSTLLRYSGIDFIGGTCDADATHGPRILYQAVCSGSGCDDASNWGVINPDSLQVLLVPAPGNLDSTTALLGHRPALKGAKMSVSAEAHRLGLPTP